MSDAARYVSTNGACPYCGGTSFSHHSTRRPLQVVETCGSCGKYSVRDARTGKRFPLEDPMLPSSPPHT